MNLEARVDRLEQATPSDIVLVLADGTEFRYVGSPLRFVTDAAKQIERGGSTPIADACCRMVKATGCGLLHELVAALVEQP